MKILFLTNIPAPYRVDFFNELGNYCKLTVLYERNSLNHRNEKWLSCKTTMSTTFNEEYLKGLKVRNSAICFSVLKWLKKKDFDLIVVGGYSTPTGIIAIEFLNYNKIQFVINSDGGFINYDNKLKYFIKKHLISKATAWLSTGKCTDEYLLKHGAKKNMIYRYLFTSLKKEDILNEPLGKDIKLKLRKKLKINEEKVVISVGQFVYRKGFDVFLNACNNLSRDVGVYIIGGEPTEEYLEIRCHLKLTNVHFVGFKTKIELSEYYKASDLFVLPTRQDIWGLVVNEAMAKGLPVITTDRCIAGLELVKDYENGFIIPVEEEKLLYERINIILENEEMQKKMSKSSLEKIRNYTIENMATEHIKIFESIIGTKL